MSIRVWGWYIVAAGTLVALLPEAVFSVMAIPGDPDGWVRTVGVLGLVIGFYYLRAAVSGDRSFYRATLAGRLLFAAGAISVGFAVGPWQISLFGFADVAGAAWTFIALRGSLGAPAGEGSTS